MILRGVDPTKAGDQFFGCVAGRTLILDGDGPAYRAAATVKRLDTALRNYQKDILTQIFLTKAQDCRIHLTASGCDKAGRYRIKAVKPYQGNRKDKPKPSLLEPLRQAIAQRENWLPEYSVVMHHLVEADDGMMQDAYRLGSDGIIWSDDKDLSMTPYLYWDREKAVIRPSEPVGWLAPKYTPSGTLKCVGQGPLFFWAQMLMGDTADHVQGILRFNGKACGPDGALKALAHCTDIHVAANIVLDAYRVIGQNPLPEGWMLWLLRWHGDNFWEYATSLNLTEQNREYLIECRARDWFTT